MTSVLVTRPREDSDQLAGELARLGFEVMLEPLMHIHFFEDVEINLNDTQGLLFTSANGVRAFAKASSTRTLPAYCVGSATAKEAKTQGFIKIHTADGDVDKLAQLIAAKCDRLAGNLYHAAASELAGDLEFLLTAKGFKYRRAILYEAIHTESLTDQSIKAIMAEKVDAVLLFSPRTARGFVENLKAADLIDKCKNLSLFCLSLNVKNEIMAYDWRLVETADTPNQQVLLKLLKEKMG